MRRNWYIVKERVNDAERKYPFMDIYGKLKEILTKQIKRKSFDIDAVTPETSLDALGLDSLDKADLIITIEEEFELPEFSQEDMMSVETVKDIIALIEKKRG